MDISTDTCMDVPFDTCMDISTDPAVHTFKDHLLFFVCVRSLSLYVYIYIYIYICIYTCLYTGTHTGLIESKKQSSRSNQSKWIEFKSHPPVMSQTVVSKWAYHRLSPVSAVLNIIRMSSMGDCPSTSRDKWPCLNGNQQRLQTNNLYEYKRTTASDN